MAATNGARAVEEIFDLDALEPETQPPFQFKAGGETWELASPESLDFRVQHRLAQGDNYDVLEALMGDQWPDFVKLDLVIDDHRVRALIEAAGKHYGIDLPESPASPVSSNRAARRSKRTSRSTTGGGSRTSARKR